MQKEFVKIKNALRNWFVAYAKETGDVVGISLVGSHADLEKPLEKINDLDYVVIFTVFDRSHHDQLLNSMREFCHRFESDDFGFVFETRMGPFKIQGDKPYTIQLHLLLFDKPLFREYGQQKPLLAFDWQRFSPLYGQELAKISGLYRLSVPSIIKTPGGIDYFLESIHNKVNVTVNTDFDDVGQPVRKPVAWSQTIPQQAETCYKALLNCCLNIRKLATRENEKPAEQILIDFGTKSLGIAQKDFDGIQRVYKKSRNKETITSRELDDVQNKTVQILKSLKRDLQASIGLT